MAYKRFVAAAVFAALMAAGSSSVQAQAGPCRKQCDTSFSVCNKKGGDQNACLRGWHSCKKVCTSRLASAASVNRATPAKPPVTQRGR